MSRDVLMMSEVSESPVIDQAHTFAHVRAGQELKNFCKSKSVNKNVRICKRHLKLKHHPNPYVKLIMNRNGVYIFKYSRV